MIAPGTFSIAATAASAAASALAFVCGQQQKIAAADSLLGHAGGRLAQELAVHHRNPPEMLAAELLRDLPAIAEIAQRRAELELALGRPGRQSRRCRARSARIGRGGSAVASAVRPC